MYQFWSPRSTVEAAVLDISWAVSSIESLNDVTSCEEDAPSVKDRMLLSLSDVVEVCESDIGIEVGISSLITSSCCWL